MHMAWMCATCGFIPYVRDVSYGNLKDTDKLLFIPYVRDVSKRAQIIEMVMVFVPYVRDVSTLVQGSLWS